jgi:hypothetical protein
MPDISAIGVAKRNGVRLSLSTDVSILPARLKHHAEGSGKNCLRLTKTPTSLRTMDFFDNSKGADGQFDNFMSLQGGLDLIEDDID